MEGARGHSVVVAFNAESAPKKKSGCTLLPLPLLLAHHPSSSFFFQTRSLVKVRHAIGKWTLLPKTSRTSSVKVLGHNFQEVTIGKSWKVAPYSVYISSLRKGRSLCEGSIECDSYVVERALLFKRERFGRLVNSLLDGYGGGIIWQCLCMRRSRVFIQSGLRFARMDDLIVH